MNREIKFRGKSKLNNKWHFGSFVKGESEDLDYIVAHDSDLSGNGIDFNSVRVISKTVGQYTGLKDANGVEIYEGDIVECKAEESEGTLGRIFTTAYLKGVVQYKENSFCVYSDNVYNSIAFTSCETVTVIGNIHNPDLNA